MALTLFRAKLKSASHLVGAVISVWIDSNASAAGAAVAFYTIFAIAPLFVLVLALAGLYFGEQAARKELFDQVAGLVGPKGADAIQTVLAAANRPKAGTFATVMGLITLFVGATSVFIQLQQSLNSIWNVRSKGAGLRHFIRNRLLSFAALLGIGFLLLVSLIISAALAAVGKWMSGELAVEEPLWQTVDVIVSLAFITLLFAMIFKALPDVKIQWRDVWVGALITALLFTFGKFLIGFYLGRSSVASVYGAAGSFVVVLLWVYYSVQILLLGAATTRIFANRYGSAIVPSKHAEFIGKHTAR